MPIANWPPRSRSTSSDTGSETTPANSAASAHGDVGVDAVLGEHDRRVGAEADERLLADRDQPAVAGQRVPHPGQDDQHEQLAELRRDRSGEQYGTRARAATSDHDGRRRPTDARDRASSRGRPCSCPSREDRRRAGSRARSGTPGGRRGSTHCGSICAPTVCATPSTMPPTSVPHSEPRPPMTTASKAKISCAGPQRRVERRAHAEERAGQRRRGDGDRRRRGVDRARVDADQPGGVGVVGGRPHLAAERRARAGTAAARPSTSTATAKISAPSAEIESWSLMRQLPTSPSAPALSDRRVGREALQQQVLDHDREPEGGQQRHQLAGAQAAVEAPSAAAAQPSAATPGRTRISDANGRQPRVLDQHEHAGTRRAREVAVREVDDPHDAEQQRQPAGEQRVEPPSRTPWTTALTQVMRGLRPRSSPK